MLALDLAAAVIDGALGAGVREIVLCPGSRSAPLAYAALAAERAGRARVHVRTDERSACFLALGLAKLSRRPAVVITTSGTAVANLHPAVLEAHHGVVPLVVLSADRPRAVRGSGANQTTVQPGIFAGAVRWALDLDQDDLADLPPAGALARAAGAGAAAVRASAGDQGGGLSHDAGPAHLNLCLREPLVPASWPPPEPGPGQDALPDAVAGAAPQPTVTPAPTPLPEARRPGASGGMRDDVPRTLLVLGDLVDARSRAGVLAWAHRRDLPVVAEPFGEHTPTEAAVMPHGPLVLTAHEWLEAHPPDRVLVAGRVTLSRPVMALMRREQTQVDALADTALAPDPAGVVRSSYPLEQVIEDAADGAGPNLPRGRAAWTRLWREAAARIGAGTEAPSWPSGLAIARTLVEALRPVAARRGATLFVGPSNPVRDLDFGMPGYPPGLTVVASRGLAGIDGCVSTAIGIALADPGRAGYALVGDLTFLHDANGLLIGPGEPRPDLTIVVVNDGGGGIFRLLEPGAPALADPFARLFATPTGTDLGALCAAHGVAHRLAADPATISAIVAEPAQGLRVIEVRLDPEGHRPGHALLREGAARALA